MAMRRKSKPDRLKPVLLKPAESRARYTSNSVPVALKTQYPTHIYRKWSVLTPPDSAIVTDTAAYVLNETIPAAVVRSDPLHE